MNRATQEYHHPRSIIALWYNTHLQIEHSICNYPNLILDWVSEYILKKKQQFSLVTQL